MILLDTNAVIYLIEGRRRGRRLAEHAGVLRLSPLVLIELRMAQVAGRGEFTVADPVAAARADPRWAMDDAPLEGVVAAAMPLDWTRDPMDRLIAGHALYRGWRLATSDRRMLANLPPGATLAL